MPLLPLLLLLLLCMRLLLLRLMLLRGVQIVHGQRHGARVRVIFALALGRRA